MKMVKTWDNTWKVLWISWKALGIYSILSIFGKIYESTLYPFLQMFVLAKILDMIGSGKHLVWGDFTWMIVTYVSATFVKVIMTTFLDNKQLVLENQMMHYIDYQIDKKLTKLDPATFENVEFQNLLAQIEGVKGTMTAYLIRIVAFIDHVVKIVTATVILLFAFPFFIPIVVVATVPSFLAAMSLREKVWPFLLEKNSLVNRISGYIRTLLSADGTSKEAAIYQTGHELLLKVKQQQRQFITKFHKSVDQQMVFVILSRIFQILAFLGTQAFNLSAVMAGKLGVGQFTLYFQQTFNLALGVEGVLDNYSSMVMRSKYLDKYFEFQNIEPIIRSPDHPLTLPASPHPPVIEFKDVSFKYPGTERYIYKNLSFMIGSGEKIALVGVNGAGKTTLIKLMLRFHDPTEGEILVNGVNLKELNLRDWYEYVGALFQDFIRYQFSFKENIFYGDMNKVHTEKALEEAITKSGADEYIDSLPKKYDQIVGKMFKDGVDLSGGQWQKLALARAFYRNAPILILDEPTSAIDAKAEFEIFERVQKLQKDKTVIIISHRFSTVRNADRIIVINDGKIVENGNHELLMNKRGLYAELFNIQAQGYK